MRFVVRRIDTRNGLRAFSIDEGDTSYRPVGEVYVRDVDGPGGHRDEDEARLIAHLFAEAPYMAALLQDVEKFCPVDTQDHIRRILQAVGWPPKRPPKKQETT